MTARMLIILFLAVMLALVGMAARAANTLSPRWTAAVPYPKDRNDSLYGFAQNNDGTIYILTQSKVDPNSQLARLDDHGKLVWRIDLPFGGYGVDCDSAGAWVVGYGYIYSADGTRTTPHVARISSDGKILWHKDTQMIPKGPRRCEGWRHGSGRRAVEGASDT